MNAKAIKMIDELIADEDTEEIILDDLEISEISPELKKKLESLEETMQVLSLNNCKLKTLSNFPHLPNLIRLELMNNEFPAHELKNLADLKDLQSLSLSDNDIKSADDLKCLAGVDLAQLDLSGCELAKQADYRDKVFRMFQNLQILDNKDKDGNEVDYEEDDFENDEEGEDDFEDAEDFEDDEDMDDEEDFEDDDEEDDEDDEEESNKRTKK